MKHNNSYLRGTSNAACRMHGGARIRPFRGDRIMNAKTTLCALSALLATAAFAGETDTTSGAEVRLPSFLSLDTNRDGALTRHEAQNNSAVIDRWDTLDANHNGTISAAEYADATGQTPPNGRD